MCRADDYPPHDVPMAEQVLLAERMVDILREPSPPPSDFAELVLIEAGITDEHAEALR